ncbi:MAG: hypothetical protein ACRDSP_26730 [Pseudonocardiaceae bacterium]
MNLAVNREDELARRGPGPSHLASSVRPDAPGRHAEGPAGRRARRRAT